MPGAIALCIIINRKSDDMGQIKLNGMEFYAYHGCYPEEKRAGNHFVVDIVMDFRMKSASESDDLRDTVDYAKVYGLVKREMAIPSNLLEHVSARILEKIIDDFPQIERIEVSVTKLNPPVDGQMKSVCVSQKRC